VPHASGDKIETLCWGTDRAFTERIAEITAELEKLEKALSNCADGGIRNLIEDWITEAKQRLASEQK
jgi:hypothetical protein